MTVLLTPLPQGRNAAQKALSQGCDCVTAGSIPETPRRKAKRAWQASRSARSKIYSQGSEKQHKPTKSVCSAFARFPMGKSGGNTALPGSGYRFSGRKAEREKNSPFRFRSRRRAGLNPIARQVGRDPVSSGTPGKLNGSAAVFCGSGSIFFRQTDKRIAKFIPKEDLIYEKGDHQRKSERVSV